MSAHPPPTARRRDPTCRFVPGRTKPAGGKLMPGEPPTRIFLLAAVRPAEDPCLDTRRNHPRRAWDRGALRPRMPYIPARPTSTPVMGHGGACRAAASGMQVRAAHTCPQRARCPLRPVLPRPGSSRPPMRSSRVLGRGRDRAAAAAAGVWFGVPRTRAVFELTDYCLPYNQTIFFHNNFNIISPLHIHVSSKLFW